VIEHLRAGKARYRIVLEDDLAKASGASARLIGQGPGGPCPKGAKIRQKAGIAAKERKDRKKTGITAKRHKKRKNYETIDEINFELSRLSAPGSRSSFRSL
jgi:hypothetical protein